MKVTLELGKTIGLAGDCFKHHDFELRIVQRSPFLPDYEVFFCRKCGAKVRIK